MTVEFAEWCKITHLGNNDEAQSSPCYSPNLQGQIAAEGPEECQVRCLETLGKCAGQ